MAAQDFLFEESSASFQAYAKLGSALRQFRFELGLQNLDFCRQCRDFRIHRKLPVAGSLKHSTRGVAFFVGFTAIEQASPPSDSFIREAVASRSREPEASRDPSQVPLG
jgi:hypothetical protein